MFTKVLTSLLPAFKNTTLLKFPLNYASSVANACDYGKNLQKDKAQLRMNIEKKSAIITGGAGSLGLSIAADFLCKGGRKVMLLNKDVDLGKYSEQILQDAFGSKKIEFLEMDVTNFKKFDEAFQESMEKCGGTIDVLVNNAEEDSERDWSKQVDVNIKGTYGGTLLAFKYMGANNGGKGGIVINRSSTAGLYTMPQNPVFCATKHGVNWIARNFGGNLHYDKTDVRVVSYCPGIFDSTLENAMILPPLYGDAENNKKRIFKKLRQIHPSEDLRMLGKVVSHLIQHAPTKSIWCPALSLEKSVHIPDRHSLVTRVLTYTGGDENEANEFRSQPEFLDISGKVAIVSGGGTGIGYETVKQLLRHDAKGVVFFERRVEVGKEALNMLTEEFGPDRIKFVQGDVTKDSDFKQVFEETIQKYGHVDILFNNAGLLNNKEWAETSDTNLAGTIRGIYLAFKYMGRNAGGSGGVVINNAGISALGTVEGAPASSSTKRAVLGASTAFGNPYHYNRNGVRVICLCPGPTMTHLAEVPTDLDDEWMRDVYKKTRPLPHQHPAVVGKSVIDLIRFCPSGSVWSVEDCKLLRVTIPHYSVEMENGANDKSEEKDSNPYCS